MNAQDRIKATNAPDLSEFAWEDPFRLADQLTEDERMLAESARAFADSRLAPRIRAAYAEERVEPEVMAEMGEGPGCWASRFPKSSAVWAPAMSPMASWPAKSSESIPATAL